MLAVITVLLPLIREGDYILFALITAMPTLLRKIKKSYSPAVNAAFFFFRSRLMLYTCDIRALLDSKNVN